MQVILGAVVLILVTIPMFWKLGTEFMPAMDEYLSRSRTSNRN